MAKGREPLTHRIIMEKPEKPNLSDIASNLGISKMTVSRVLRGGAGFSDATKEKVLREVERVGYVPDRIAAAFGRAKASTLVGICLPRLTSPLFASVADTLSATFSRLGYQTMIGTHNHSPEEEEAWLRNFASWKPAAVVLAGRNHSPSTGRLLRSLGVPVAEIWDLTTKPYDLAIGFSHYDNGFEMARVMVDAGHITLGYVGALAAYPSASGHVRRRGFAEGLATLGASLVAEEIVHGTPGFYAGFVGTETLLARRGGLDAIYYHDDEMAIGGLSYLTKIGLRVPEDIGIAGWGGLEAAAILPKRLTTTVVPTARLAKQAAQAVVARLNGDAAQDVILIETRLARGSTI